MSRVTSSVLLQVICNDSTKSGSPISSGVTTTSVSASEPMDCNLTPPHSSPLHVAKSSVEGVEDISMADTGSTVTRTGTSMQIEPAYRTSNCSSSTMIVECTSGGNNSLPERLGSFIKWEKKNRLCYKIICFHTRVIPQHVQFTCTSCPLCRTCLYIAFGWQKICFIW
jgi:hypothetical protein